MGKVRVNRGRLNGEFSVKLYEVYNTAHNGLYVLARDPDAAMSIAWTANHIHLTGFGFSKNFSRHSAEVTRPIAGKLVEFWPAIQCAIARGMEGTLHLEDGHVSVGHEVVEP